MWLLVASVVVLALVAIGGAYVAMSRDGSYPDQWDNRVAPLADWVAQERGLEFQHPVQVNFLSESEYTAAATAEPATDAGRRADADLVAQMRALGLVAGEVDLNASVNTITDQGTLAFYQPSSRQIYVRGSTITPAMRVTLVHELVHVLQDQNFDLTRVGSPEADPQGTLRAVAEGDAGRMERRYVADVLTAAEREEYLSEITPAADDAEALLSDQVPDGLTAVFSAPYLFGEPFVAFLDQRGGNAEVDKALKQPPGARVLFNPQLWGTPAESDEAVEVLVPPGVERVGGGQLGAPVLYMVLAARTSPQQALATVDEVAGESYVAYRDGSRVCVRATLVGADEGASALVERALVDWIGDLAPEVASVSRDLNDAVQLQTCDPGPSAATVGVSMDSLNLPLARSVIFVQVVSAGGTDSEGTCVVGQVLPTLTPEELASGAAGDPALRPRLAEAVAGCRGAS